ncbi:MAG: transcriptional regulator, LysR family protein [Lachnospiraceae bacterium]|jgi:DNA-binding transcriptional LysR family regulator|nr:transcriptional regulator, LysR family protein [Lachnospiraceae bacterium]
MGVKMNLKQLEYFLAIAETGQITTAAKNLNVSQPPLSVQLKLLEDELNTELFVRNSRNLTITNDGLLLKEKAEQIFTLFDSIYTDFNSSDYKSTRTINIGSINISFFNEAKTQRISQGIQNLHQKHPKSTFQLFSGSSTRIKELLDDGTISLGFVRYPLTDSAYACINITEEHDCYVAVGHVEYFKDETSDTIPFKELEGVPLIIHNSITSMIQDYCEGYSFTPTISFKTDYDSFSYELALARLGVAILPISCINTMLHIPYPVKIVKIIEPSISSNLYLVYRKQKYLSSIIKEFISFFTED